MPGMKSSSELETVLMGTPVTADHCTPFVDVLITMSFAAKPDRNRQSCQTTYTFPAASTPAEGSGPPRSPPATVWELILVIVVTLPQCAPPSVEVNAPTEVS